MEERERRFRESEERYRSFIEHSTEGIWRFELEEPVPTDLRPGEQVERFYRHGYLAECNDAMARMYGYTRAEEIVGARLGDLFPPSIRQNVEYLKAFVRSGYRLTDTEFEEVDRHGDTKQFLSNLTGIVEDESLVRVWVSQRDITERKRAEEALKQSELLYHTLIEQATENIFLVDTETRRIMESNPAFQRTFGYTEEELRTMTLYDIVAAERKSIDRNIRRVQGKAPFVGERKYRRKDGSLVDVEVSASIILRNGRETMCVVAHDVTERKKNEETQRFLAEAGASLSSSLDYRSTLSRMAHLAVPYLADWCAVDIVEEDGSLERLAMAHQDPEKIALARELEERYPPDPEAPQGVAQVLRTCQSELVPEIPEQVLEQAVRDEEHREILQRLGLKSYMIVPLVARGRTLGAITLVSAESGRRYGQAELELAEELARRAALAVDNARLYRGRSEIARTLPPPGGGVARGAVCGGGGGAAAFPPPPRHTIRAVAMRETRPSAILAG